MNDVDKHKFNDRHDTLNREQFCQNIETLIRSEIDISNGSLVVGLHGEYGSGKTRFIQQWISKIEDDNSETIKELEETTSPKLAMFLTENIALVNAWEKTSAVIHWCQYYLLYQHL